MSYSLRLPGWAVVPLTFFGVAGLVMFTYPGGLSAAYRDVQDASVVNAELEHASRVEWELRYRTTTIVDRITMKERLVSDVIDGRVSLETAGEHFRALITDEPLVLTVLQDRYTGLPEDQLAELNVLEYVTARRCHLDTEVLERLHRDFEERHGQAVPPVRH